MAVIKLTEEYSVSQLRKDVRDSLTLAGEQAVLLQLYHPGDADAVRCVFCGDDIYKSPETSCPECYGTSWQNGVRQAVKVWALFSDQQVNEKLGKQGTFDPDFRGVQTEAFPMLIEHDVICRVREWSPDGSVLSVKGFYILQEITRRSLRTGSRAGQYPYDVVAQKAQLSAMPDGSPLTRYPVIGHTFEESMVIQRRAQTEVPEAIVVQPDSKVVYFPFDPSSGKPTWLPGVNRTYAQTIGDGANTTFLVTHNFGTKDVEVGIYDAHTGEEVEADITHISENAVRVVFALAPNSGAYRCVVQGS